MTHNSIEYMKALESRRHDLATEDLTARENEIRQQQVDISKQQLELEAKDLRRRIKDSKANRAKTKADTAVSKITVKEKKANVKKTKADTKLTKAKTKESKANKKKIETEAEARKKDLALKQLDLALKAQGLANDRARLELEQLVSDRNYEISQESNTIKRNTLIHNKLKDAFSNPGLLAYYGISTELGDQIANGLSNTASKGSKAVGKVLDSIFSGEYGAKSVSSPSDLAITFGRTIGWYPNAPGEKSIPDKMLQNIGNMLSDLSKTFSNAVLDSPLESLFEDKRKGKGGAGRKF